MSEHTTLFGVTAARWDELTRWPLAAAAVLLLVLYSLKVLLWQDTPAGLIVGAVVVWVVFAVNYVVAFYLAPSRRRWFWVNLPMLFVVLLPMLQPVVLVGFIGSYTAIQRSAAGVLRSRIFVQVLLASALLTYIAALTVLDVEHTAPHTSIESFGDALWWAVMTITTVGYGDVVPSTSTGRLVGGVLMICGVLAVGCITAVLASLLTDVVRNHHPSPAHSDNDELHQLRREVERLRQLLDNTDT